MDCEKISAVVYQYLDSEIAVEIRAEIHEHLSKCPDCDSVVEFERRLKMLVERACRCSNCPDGLEERILRALEEVAES